MGALRIIGGVSGKRFAFSGELCRVLQGFGARVAAEAVLLCRRNINVLVFGQSCARPP